MGGRPERGVRCAVCHRGRSKETPILNWGGNNGDSCEDRAASCFSARKKAIQNKNPMMGPGTGATGYGRVSVVKILAEGGGRRPLSVPLLLIVSGRPWFGGTT